jgi:serine/threonine protein phosphatase 1
MIWDRSMDGYNGPYHDDVFVVRGHTPGYTIKLQSNQLNIDTACVFGGTLTCAVIDPESGDPLEYHQVKSGYSYN